METVLRAAWAVVLARHTSSSDVLFFSSFDDIQPWLAPLRVVLPAKSPVSEWIDELEDWLRKAEEHGPVPAQLMTQAPQNSLAHTLPTFLIVPPEASAFPPRDQIKGPLLVIVRLDISKIEIHYDSAWFDQTEIEALGNHLNVVLLGIEASPQSAVGNLPVLTGQERRLLLDEWNDTAAPFAENTCIHEFFEEQAARAPDTVAVVFRDRQWTYRELNAQAEIVARRLKSAGVGPGTFVAICLNRSLELVAALLAVFKAGGAYVPLDPSYPTERLTFMIDDAKPAVIVVSQQTSALFPLLEQRLLRIDATGDEAARGTIHQNPVPPQSSDAAYVLYTSGSTGKPKGVIVTHRNVSNFFTAMDAVIGAEPGVWLAVTSVNFDISVFELFWTLARGFRIILQEEGPWASQSDSKYSLPEQMKRHGVTHLQCTPSLASMLICDSESVNALKPLRRFMVGGEPLPLDLAHRLAAIISGDLFNLYGPTETTVWSAAQLIRKKEKQILIGRPVANTRLYVLDAERKLVPIGSVGELYIGGDGLAREYLNRPDVTRERFVTHAFSPGRPERLYRTGDLVRHTRDGRLEFMGRTDQQIKIRGVRIELGEIEVVLREHPRVRDAVVVVQEHEMDDKRLVAYVVPSSPQPPSASQLQEWLGSKLPKILVPSALVFLPEFPKTPNGKLDRRALPKAHQKTSGIVEGASNDLERQTAAISSDALDFQTLNPPTESKTAEDAPRRAGVTSPGKVDDWFYRSIWKQAPLPPAPPSAGPWLFLGDPSPANQKLIDELRKQKASVITVVAGEKFQSPGEDSYVMNPSSEKDYLLLFDYLAQRRQLPRQIVHLWGMEPVPAAAAEDRCFHTLLFLIQTLGARLPDQTVAITAVSRRSVSIRHEPVLHPHGSLLSGPCRVAPLEYPNLRCRQIDVDSTDPAALAQTILREGESDASINLAAYRDGNRWTQDIERFRLEPATDPLRQQGVYLITGGLGALGMAMADWLARTCRARLVLISRHGEPYDDVHQTRFVEWRKLGAEVLPLAADVTDRESLRSALDLAREKFGPLHGIIHAAGILQDGIIQLKKKDAAHRVLAPKTAGLEILDELTRDNPLDFFALFSSVSALTPPDGQVDYCAANAFLNAFAQSRPPERNFIVIGWGPWAEIGMVAPKPGSASESAPFHHPLLEHVDLDTAARAIYSGTLSVERHWILSGHRFHGGDALLPGTAHLEIAVAALWKKIGKQPVTLENVIFLAPLRIALNSPEVVRAELQKAGLGYQFSIASHDVVYVSGQCRRSPGPPPPINLTEILARCPTEKHAPLNVRQRGHFDFGPRWQSLRQIAFGKDECLGTVELPSKFQSETRDFALHPALMDVAIDTAIYLIPGYDEPGDMLLPFAYKRVAVYGTLPPRVYSHARMRHSAGPDLLVFDVTLAAENGEVIAEIEEFTVKRVRSVADLSNQATDPALEIAGGSSRPPAGIPTKEGIEAFQRILKNRPAGMVFVSPAKLSPATSMGAIETLANSVTASADDIELVLRQLWQRLLGLDRIDAKTDFFDSGGHSLLAVRLFTEIRKRFNINFGLSTLFEARTMGALAELIRKAREADPSKKNPASAHALVAIRSSGSESNTPLFLIHDIGGGVLRYEHLARHFPDDQSIYAIESRGLSGLPVDYSVEVMARHYIRKIRERQPHGPYFVVGHSFGGLVTYEIARQLSALNEPMGLVGLLDTFQRNVVEEDSFLQAAPQKLGKLSAFNRLTKDIRMLLMGRDRIGYFQERKTYIQARARKTLYRSAYKVSTRFGSAMPSFLKDVKEANWIASDHFTPEPYDGAVVLFRCQNRIDTDPPDSSRVWQRLVRGGVEILEVPGDHNSMLREPNVRILAEQILTYLQPQNAKPPHG